MRYIFQFALTFLVTLFTTTKGFATDIAIPHHMGIGPACCPSCIINACPGQSAQSITFNPPAQTQVALGTTITLSATATSTIPVTFSAQPSSVCSLASNGTSLTYNGPGTCTVTASQSGNTSWLAATPVTKTINMTTLIPSAQTITFNPPAQTQIPLTATVSLSATASSGLPVTLTAQPSSVCSLASNGVTLNYNSPGTCTVTASQSGNPSWSPATTVSKTINMTTLNDQTLLCPVLTMPNATSPHSVAFEQIFDQTLGTCITNSEATPTANHLTFIFVFTLVDTNNTLQFSLKKYGPGGSQQLIPFNGASGSYQTCTPDTRICELRVSAKDANGYPVWSLGDVMWSGTAWISQGKIYYYPLTQ